MMNEQDQPSQVGNRKPSDGKPKLLDQVRRRCRVQHLALSTEKQYVSWIRRFILFHHKRHPLEMGNAEVTAFLTHLAVEGHVAASTQNQALAALLFLYRVVLERDFGWLDNVVRASKAEAVARSVHGGRSRRRDRRTSWHAVADRNAAVRGRTATDGVPAATKTESGVVFVVFVSEKFFSDGNAAWSPSVVSSRRLFLKTALCSIGWPFVP